MKNSLKYFVAIFFLILHAPSYSQTEKKMIREGNTLYNEEKYKEAEERYQKSLDKNKESVQGNFNLGDAYYKQKKYDEAIKQFEAMKSQKLDSATQAAVWHNLGNAYLQKKNYEESIAAFKQALKLNPKDEDTRYNLAYAQSMLKKEKEQQEKNKQNENKDKKEEKKENKKEQQNPQEQKQEQSPQNKKQQQQQQKKQISKEDAERILQALNSDEKNKRKKEKLLAPVKVDIEKDW